MITLEIDPSTFDGDNNPPEVRVNDVVIVNPEGNWHLYNHGHLELTKNCDEQYLNFWDFPEEKIKSALIIGGGDYQLVSKLVPLKHCKIDLVDPNSYLYIDFHKFYLKENFNYCYNHVLPIYKKFSIFLYNYLDVQTPKVYDLVCIDISEPLLGITDEIYCEDFFINLKKIKAKTYMMYMPPTVYNKLVPILRQNFTMISSKGDFVNDWNEQCDIITFKHH